MLAKNLNNAYFGDNAENDDVKNTGFNLFLFKDTIVKIEFEWWSDIKKAFIYAGFKQICLITGNDLAKFWVSLIRYIEYFNNKKTLLIFRNEAESW